LSKNDLDLAVFLPEFPRRPAGRILRRDNLYDDEADCAAETRFEFMRQVARWKLPKGDRLAANLWMNTRRELLRRNVKSKKEANAIREATTAAGLLVEAAAEDEEEKEAVEVSVGHLWQLEPGGPRPYDPDDLELRRGLAWLMRKGGFSAEDAALVFARYLCRLPWKTIAERLGINAETARKRARELAQIVRDIPDIWESCPGFDDFMCIPQVEGSEGETLH
jgi:DNA-directed RNA polymerase specialized sigma24 family protein